MSQAVLAKIAERVIRSHEAIVFVVGPWDRMESLIDKARTAIMVYATGGGRNQSNAHTILEPRGANNSIFLQAPRRSYVNFFTVMPSDADLVPYALVVAPDLDGAQTYFALTHAEWAHLRDRKSVV